MGFLFSPQRKPEAQQRMQVIMSETKRAMEHCVPFAMEPVVYNFAINERGTAGRAARRRRRAHARRLLHARRASAAAHRSAQPLRRTPRRTGTLHRRLPHRATISPAWCTTSSTTCCRARRTSRPDRAQTLEALLETHGFDRVQHEQIQTDLRSGRIGLAQNRLPVTSHIEDAAPDELDPRHRALRHAGAGRRACRRGHPGRRRGQPLDQGRGRGQGAQPVLQARRAASQLHRNASGQEPARGPRMRHAAAAHRHHQLPDPRRHRAASRARGQLPLPRAAAALARAHHRPAHDPHGARPALRLGRDAAADAGRAGAEGPRGTARRAHQVGRAGGRRLQLHGQSADAVPASGGALVRSAQPAAQRHAAAPAGGAPAPELPAGAQHRYRRGGRGRRAARPAHRERRGA